MTGFRLIAVAAAALCCAAVPAGAQTGAEPAPPAQAAAPARLAPHAWLMAGDTIVLGGTAEDYARHRALHDFTLPGART